MTDEGSALVIEFGRCLISHRLNRFGVHRMIPHQKVVWLGFSAQKVGAGREDKRLKPELATPMPGTFRVFQIVANDCRNGTYEMAAE